MFAEKELVKSKNDNFREHKSIYFSTHYLLYYIIFFMGIAYRNSNEINEHGKGYLIPIPFVAITMTTKLYFPNTRNTIIMYIILNTNRRKSVRVCGFTIESSPSVIRAPSISSYTVNFFTWWYLNIIMVLLAVAAAVPPR
jgi:uncharacterized membrane protein YdbT with pleckstrin-like domain